MISGVPILLFAPFNTALYNYFETHGAGLLICENDEALFETSILKLWKDIDFRKRISSNAVKQALQDSDAKVVRENFRRYLKGEERDEI
jgi:hypothetical protein